jgi:hypothetical protein
LRFEAIKCRSSIHSAFRADQGWNMDGRQSQSIDLVDRDHICRSVHLMKKWLTGGTLQGVMGQVVGCGVVNVMVGLSVYKFAYCIRLVVHVQLFIISFMLF